MNNSLKIPSQMWLSFFVEVIQNDSTISILNLFSDIKTKTHVVT